MLTVYDYARFYQNELFQRTDFLDCLPSKMFQLLFALYNIRKHITTKCREMPYKLNNLVCIIFTRKNVSKVK